MTQAARPLAESLVGRTITRVRWFDADPDRLWAHHETCWQDADGATITELDPLAATEAAVRASMAVQRAPLICRVCTTYTVEGRFVCGHGDRTENRA